MAQFIYVIKLNYSIKLIRTNNNVLQFDKIKFKQLYSNLYYISSIWYFNSLKFITNLIISISCYLLAFFCLQQVKHSKVLNSNYWNIWKTTLNGNYIRKTLDFSNQTIPLTQTSDRCVYLFIYLCRIKVYFFTRQFNRKKIKLVRVLRKFNYIRSIWRLKFFNKFRANPVRMRQMRLRANRYLVRFTKKKINYINFLKQKKHFLSMFWRRKNYFLYRFTFLNYYNKIYFNIRQTPTKTLLHLPITWIKAVVTSANIVNYVLFSKPLYLLLRTSYIYSSFELNPRLFTNHTTNLLLLGQNFKKLNWSGYGLWKWHNISVTYTYLYFTKLVRFLEFCTGKLVNIYIERNFVAILTTQELLICALWSKRLLFYRRLVGHNLFVKESLQIIWLTLKTKDPVFFLSWVQVTLTKISFWKHRAFLRYLQYVFLIISQYYFPILAIKGIRLVVKGKISSAGNSRKRKVHISVGHTSFSTLTNRIVYHYKQVSTFTGALGLKFWICF